MWPAGCPSGRLNLAHPLSFKSPRGGRPGKLASTSIGIRGRVRGLPR